MGARRLARGSGAPDPSAMRTSVRSRMSESTLKGAIAEAAITAEAIKLGVVVLRPFPEGRRYALVFDVDHRLYRVQCKWRRHKDGVMVVPTRTCRHTPSGYVRTAYGADEVEAIAKYWEATE